MKKRPDGLSKERLAALLRFIAAHKFDWKQKLSAHFAAPEAVRVPEADAVLLRQLRNNVPPSYWRNVTADVLAEWEREDAIRDRAYSQWHDDGKLHVEGERGADPEVMHCGDYAWVQAWVRVDLNEEK